MPGGRRDGGGGGRTADPLHPQYLSGCTGGTGACIQAPVGKEESESRPHAPQTYRTGGRQSGARACLEAAMRWAGKGLGVGPQLLCSVLSLQTPAMGRGSTRGEGES